jgi:hypothetical protein
VNLPSPSMSVIEQVSEASPSTSSATPFKYASSPASAVQQPSPPRFEYDYGLQSSPLSQSNPNPWNGNEEQRSSGLDLYGSSSEAALYPNSYGYPTSLDGYPGYDASDLTMAGLSVTPPSSSFAATGLPFRGLDYIRNYNPGGFPTNDQDVLWQSYDPGAFGYDPDLPFNLGDHALDLAHHPS